MAKIEDTKRLKKIPNTTIRIKHIKLASDVFKELNIKTNKSAECFFMEANLKNYCNNLNFAD